MAMISWADLFRARLGNYGTSSILHYPDRPTSEEQSLDPLLSDTLQLQRQASGQTTAMADSRSNVAYDRKVASVEADGVPNNEVSRDPSPDGFVTEEKVKVPWYAYIWD